MLEQGVAAHKGGQIHAAEERYRRVIREDPWNVKANHLLGLIAKGKRQYEHAVRLIGRAVERSAGFAEAQYNLPSTYWELGNVDAAIASFDRAVAAKPDFADAWVNKGRSLHQRGEREAAPAACHEALRLNPDSGKAWANLSFAELALGRSPDIAAMQAALIRLDPRSEDARSLHFAIAGALDAAGDIERAMCHYQVGKSIVRSGSRYDLTANERYMANIAAAFPRDRVAALRGAGVPSPRRIFVLGMPRAGTTLVEQILASHPRVWAGGERQDMQRVLNKVNVPGAQKARYPAWMAALGKDDTHRIAQAYLDALPEQTANADRITDKLPGNYCVLGLIHLILPNAAIIHVHREPADTCVSCYLHKFTRGHEYTLDQIDLGRYYRAYSHLMQHWREVLPGRALLNISYEDLIAEPERQTARILAHCGLQWDDRCLRFHETDRPVRTASMEQVRQPLYTGLIGRWQRYAPPISARF